MLIHPAPALFLPPLGRRPWRLGLGFFAFFSWLLVGLDDLGGEQAHFLHAADGLVLAGDFDAALGFLARASSAT
jgi:hypothetical protein